MSLQTPGIHHVTAIAGDAQRNLDFYAGVLGLRFVKRTVNFDDPFTYHLYYGDETGRPGTVLTFFPFERARPGVAGRGQARTTAFLVPPGSLDWWADRLAERGIDVARRSRLDEAVLAFTDPDGLPLELVGRVTADDVEAWSDGPVPAADAVRGFDGVTLAPADLGATADLLEFMGLERVADADGRVRLRTGGELGATVDLVEAADPGIQGAGTVHHVAFRAPDEATQAAWRESLIERGLRVTGVKDRQYFRSVYFREPGGVLFEIATDGPGFTRDEDAESLGTGLKLPPWLEEDRDAIEGQLPPLVAPDVEALNP